MPYEYTRVCSWFYRFMFYPIFHVPTAAAAHDKPFRPKRVESWIQVDGRMRINSSEASAIVWKRQQGFGFESVVVVPPGRRLKVIHMIGTGLCCCRVDTSCAST